MSRRTTLRVAVVFLAFLVLGPPAPGQDNPVYVDDSPRARERFKLAEDQVADNAAEAVRLFQQLLDQDGQRLIPLSAEDMDTFTSVRRRVLARLLSDN